VSENPEDGLPRLRDVIAKHRLSARKGLGQNFVLDLNLTRRIARAAGPFDGGAVYEVGSGPGGLTRGLFLEGAGHVLAVERDTRFAPILAEIGEAVSGRLDIVDADALKLDEAALLAAHGIALPVPVVANLPFNVGTALLVKWLKMAQWPPWWASLTLMFQKEVAQRVCAKPGENDYGRLSVLAGWRCRAKILFDVNRSAFVPQPKVTASVLHIEPLRSPRFAARLNDLETVSAAAFGQRRKMLRRSLRQLTPDADALLKTAGIEGTARAQELDIEQFCALARAYGNHRSENE